MEFININGEKVDTEAKVEKAKKPRATSESSHKGWFALGYPREVIRAGELEHNGSGASEPFDPVSYMRKNAPTKIRTKPYFNPSSAQEACDIATKAGWIGCYVRAAEKTGKGK